MDLSGTWNFELDPHDKGMTERWFERALKDQIQLPGCLQAQGYGEDISVQTPWVGSIIDRSWYTDSKYAPYCQPGNIKIPFWLQPEKYYCGVAWYQRTLEIPADWSGQWITLLLERPHWETRVWLDQHVVGFDRSLSSPHVYDLGASLPPGSHRLTIRIDNRMLVNVGPNAHSLYDGTQTNWNGIVGQLALRASSPVWLDEIEAYPDVPNRAAWVKVRVGNALAERLGEGRLTLRAAAYNSPRSHTPAAVSTTFEINAGGADVEVRYPLGDAMLLWDEFSPALYRLEADLEISIEGRPHADHATVTFGMRALSVQGTRLAINDRPLFLRGTLECCIFPLTGYPPTAVEDWKRIIRICQAHGLNHIRFHSWCPPEAAFIAADELGFYYHVECGVWTNVGEGDAVDEWLYEEGRRISAAYGNHPSFLMLAHGNEPTGQPESYLGQWVTYWKQADPRRFYTGGAGWPLIPENDYHVFHQPRIQHWEEGMKSRINSQPPETVTDYREDVEAAGAPLISHEIGQWCAYPNFDQIPKYTGRLKARNFEIFRNLLAAHQLSDQAHDFVMASGKLQVLCYKEEIESALRTPGFAGFQLLDLHDFPGQGTALIGVLDAFWDSKGYITPEEYRRFCNTTVTLARLPKRTWHTGETLRAEICLAHTGPAPLEGAVVVWKLVDEQASIIAHGRFEPMTIPLETGFPVGAIEIDLGLLNSPTQHPDPSAVAQGSGAHPSTSLRSAQDARRAVEGAVDARDVTPARKYSLVVGLEGLPIENDWDLWVFPAHLESTVPDGVRLVDALDDQALAALERGEKVLLTLSAKQIQNDIALGFSPIFWNTAFTNRQAPHTLGLLCDPAHPVFRNFPTDYHTNWQWWELIHEAKAMILDDLPFTLRPLVQVIDDWFENRRLGLLWEAKVGAGCLMVCSMDLKSDLDHRLVARQLRRSILDYMASDEFQPTIEVSVKSEVLSLKS
jgi:hypothetical protein